jgi:transketolase
MLEDIGLMRMLPGMVVINPGDAEEARKAVVAAATHVGPVYLRFGRSNTPVFTTKDTPFSIGKALTLWESERPRIALVGTGSMSYSALVAARALEAEGIGSIVLHVPTIKPLDEETLLDVAKQVVAVVTIEEHQAMGGFGSAVTEYLSSTHPIRVERVGIEDQFGQSGEPSELIEHYGLGVAHLVGVAKRALGAL